MFGSMHIEVGRARYDGNARLVCRRTLDNSFLHHLRQTREDGKKGKTLFLALVYSSLLVSIAN